MILKKINRNFVIKNLHKNNPNIKVSSTNIIRSN
jgi:hypothetical protein